MKLALHTLLLLLLTVSCRAAVSDYDVVIVGGTPAGITAAIAAAREGKSCARSTSAGCRSTASGPPTSPHAGLRPGSSHASSP